MWWLRHLYGVPQIFHDDASDGGAGGAAAADAGNGGQPDDGVPALSDEDLQRTYRIEGLDRELSLGEMINAAKQVGELETRVATLAQREQQLVQLDYAIRLREQQLASAPAVDETPALPDPEKDPEGYFREKYVAPVVKPLVKQLESLTGELDKLRPSQDAAALRGQFTDYDQFEPTVEAALNHLRQANPAVARTMDNQLGRELLYHRAKAVAVGKRPPRTKPTVNTQLPSGGERRDQGSDGVNRGARAANLIASMPRDLFEQYRAAHEVGNQELANSILRKAAKLGAA